MESMGKPSGLVRRGAVYYLRQRCPKRLQGPNSPAEISLSLHTASYAEALERIDPMRLVIREMFAATAEQRPISSIKPTWVAPRRPSDPHLPHLTDEVAARLARQFFARAVRGLDANPTVASQLDPEQADDFRRELDNREATLRGGPTHDDPTLDVEVSILFDAGLYAPVDAPATKLLREYARRALLQLAALKRARFEGDYRDFVTDALFVGPVAKEQAQPSKGQETSLEMIIGKWGRERNVSPKGLATARSAAKRFEAKVGVLPVEKITVSEIIQFKDALLAEGVTPANANTIIGRLRTLLQFALKNNVIRANPASLVSVLDKDAGRRKRMSFEGATLSAVFDSPVYKDGDRPAGGKGEAAYWLPLLALYTGARREELAQLRSTDVFEKTYLDGHDVEQRAWFMQFVHCEAEDLHVKNPGSERVVPIHRDLETLGFVDFAREAIATGQPRLFPGLKFNIYRRCSVKWGEWWGTYLRKTCGVTDKRLVFHSFRHTFKTNARHVGMDDGVSRQIMGHVPRDSAESYGGHTLHELVEGMKRYRVPGFRLPPPSHQPSPNNSRA